MHSDSPWSENTEHHRNEKKDRYISRQMTAFRRIDDGFRSHDPSVDSARPHGKPDETQVCLGFPRCPKKEYTERCVDADDHLLVFVLAGSATDSA